MKNTVRGLCAVVIDVHSSFSFHSFMFSQTFLRSFIRCFSFRARTPACLCMLLANVGADIAKQCGCNCWLRKGFSLWFLPFENKKNRYNKYRYRFSVRQIFNMTSFRMTSWFTTFSFHVTFETSPVIGHRTIDYTIYCVNRKRRRRNVHNLEKNIEQMYNVTLQFHSPNAVGKLILLVQFIAFELKKKLEEKNSFVLILMPFLHIHDVYHLLNVNYIVYS